MFCVKHEGTRLTCKVYATCRHTYETLIVESMHTLSAAFVHSAPTDWNLSAITHLQRVVFPSSEMLCS